MISKKMNEALNEQINEEYFSSYLYLSMAACFENKGFRGMAHWMRIQVKEEMVHAMKFYDFILERGGKVTLGAIEKPQSDWEAPLDMFEAGLKHECHITNRINKLMDIAEDERDRAAISFLKWFIDEQVEEEANAEEIVQQLKLFGDAPQALFMIDKDLAARVFTPPAGMEDI